MPSKIYKICFTYAAIALPIIASALLSNTSSLLTDALNIIRNLLVPLAFTLALLFFFYGVAKYIWSAGTGKEEGKKIMIWGVVALFVMSSIWGIVSFLRGELNIGSNTNMTIPTIGG